VRRVAAEAVGSALLAAAVVGSGITGERLAGGSAALALLANSLATAAMLVALIAAFGEISGARFHPLVTLLELVHRRIALRAAAAEVVAQFTGMAAGVVAANAMFGLPLVEFSTHARTGPAQWFSEGVATCGLIVVIGLCAARAARWLPFAVAGYVAAGYWFTASTCFANPAITVARCLSNSFAGIRPADVPGFLLAQLAGAAVGGALVSIWTRADRRAPATTAPSRSMQEA
jgi:glycerol uptake facilitator-like aquaporin